MSIASNIAEEKEKRIRQRLKDDFPHYASKCLFIRTKDGEVEPFVLNDAQRYLHERLEEQRNRTGKIRALVLKGRQQGCSTYTEGRFFWKTTHRRGVKAFILTHLDEATANLFGMAKRFYENCPVLVRPSRSASNAKELIFDTLDSGYKVGTAGSQGTGRGDTIQLFHGCLGLETDVLLANGTVKKLKDIDIGDKVITHKNNIGDVSFISDQEKQSFKLTLKGLRHFPLVSTKDHKFWSRDGWKKVEEISIGDCIGFPIAEISDNGFENSNRYDAGVKCGLSIGKTDADFPNNWKCFGKDFVKGLIHGLADYSGVFYHTYGIEFHLTSNRLSVITSLRNALTSVGYGWSSVYKYPGDFTLKLFGHGAAVLAEDIGEISKDSSSFYKYENETEVKIEDGYAWIPVISIEDNGIVTVRDLEVNHEDHSYCILHGASKNSEVGYWSNAETHVAGALQAVPNSPGTEVILESTSAGRSGLFFEMCNRTLAGEGEYILVFIPWFWQSEYVSQVQNNFVLTSEEELYKSTHNLLDEQIAWRRFKIVELNGAHNFRREYPATVEEAFSSEVLGALWKRELINETRHRGKTLPEFKRIVIGVDPSGGSGAGNDSQGIIAAGLSMDGHVYVLDDATCKLSPEGWGRKVVALYQKHKADRVVAESNYGGDMVKSTIQVVDRNIPVKMCPTGARGKQVRAEPIAALYEQGKVHHVGEFVALEDELVTWTPASKKSPNRLDALVWAITDLMIAPTKPTCWGIF